MSNVLTKFPTYGSMSDANSSLLRVEFKNATPPEESEEQNASVDNLMKSSAAGNVLPPPSAGPPYPQQQQPHPMPPAYPGEGTYVHPYKTATKQKGLFGGGESYHHNASGDVEGFTMLHGFTDDSIRRTFIRKVYLTLSVQLCITFGIVCLFAFVPAVEEVVKSHPWMYYVAYAVFLVLYITLMCCEGVRRKSPQNIVLLMLFTLALSYLVGTISSFYSTKAVVITLGITAVVCISVTIFSIQTKFDFTKCAGLLFVLVMVLFLFGIITIFAHPYVPYLHLIYGGLGALVFTLFLAYDTQLIMGGRSHEISPEEYIFGALTLYIDVVYLFLFILSLVGDNN